MKYLNKLNIKRLSRTRLQDIIFLMGIFLFSAVLILGLLPGTGDEASTSRSFFLYYMMMIPLIAAVYFIIISFRRKLYKDSYQVASSIRLKIAIAFVFVALLPSLPIVLISNNIINRTLSEFISGKTSRALKESIIMARDTIKGIHGDMKKGMEQINFSIQAGDYNIDAYGDREKLRKLLKMEGYDTGFFKILNSNADSNNLLVLSGDGERCKYFDKIKKFLGYIDLSRKYEIYNISIDNSSILLGRVKCSGHLISLCRVIPATLFNRISLFEDSLRNYEGQIFLKSYLKTGVGILLLLLSIFIIIIAIVISVILSRGITRPVLEIAEAAKRVAGGDFSIRLKRESPDELSLLFSSFNQMVEQLDRSRQAIYNSQKLAAWRDMAKKLVHEIKNPLTPIRLAAERVKKRYKEKHPDIDKIVYESTDTIVEEVKVLMRNIGEFSKFARLPEVKPEFDTLNPLIENCSNFFHGHEGIKFHIELDGRIGDVFFDKTLLRQALTNIIQNAVDAVGEKGNVYIISELKSGESEEIINIKIRDDGPGIRPEHMERIFEPTFSTKDKGTGLGLTIVEKIILEHNGRIYCNSGPGGTEFIIELPVIKKRDTEDGEDSNS